jgi:hypothetical protein
VGSTMSTDDLHNKSALRIAFTIFDRNITSLYCGISFPVLVDDATFKD